MDDKNPKTEEQEDLAAVIGRNLTRLRKGSGMTQLDLAEKLNYSDKSVSKWEQGNGIPDVRILVQLAELFNVSVDDLVREPPKGKPVVPKRERRLKRFVITACSVGLCWLVAVVCFALGGAVCAWLSQKVSGLWLAFVYAVPASAIVLVVFSTVWRWKWTRIVSLSVLIWTSIACVYLTLFVCGVAEGMWLLFLIGIPLQVLTLFFFLWWKRGRKQKN